MEEQDKTGLSKSAKRRAAKKAKDALGGAEEEPQAPAKAAPAAPTPAKAASKAQAKATATPVVAAPSKTAPPEAEAKAKGKAKAKAAPKEASKAPPPPAPEEQKPKAAAKKEAAAKPTAKPKPKADPKKNQDEEEEEKKSRNEPVAYYQIDDGTGGDWEMSTGLTKKQQKQKERKDQEIAMAKAQAAGPTGKRVPGMGPAELPAGQYIPGMPLPKAAGTAVSQSVNATIAAASAAAKGEEKPKEVSSTMNITVPEHRIGVVIGPKGKTIKLIQEKTGVSRIDTSGDVFTIMGPPKAVEQAHSAIQELIEKGYTCMAYDDGREEAMMVHPSTFPDIIGKQGKVIKALKEHLDVEVSLPEVPKNTDMNSKKKYKITIAGSSQKVEQAKAVINDILMYYHSEITHPGEVHEELEVDSWALRYLIGTKGSEMKHIQNNYKVRVAIPREHSVNQKVCIVGEPRDVERAKLYAEKVIWNANQPKGRDKADDGDVWGEDAEESWMSPYLYKRKD